MTIVLKFYSFRFNSTYIYTCNTVPSAPCSTCCNTTWTTFQRTHTHSNIPG